MSRYDNYIPEIIDEEIDNNINRDINESEENGSIVNNKKIAQKRSQRKNNSKDTNNKTNKFFSCLKTPAVRFFFGIVFGLFGIWLLVALISFIFVGYQDQSAISEVALGTIDNANNNAGEAGARLAEYILNDYFGVAAIVIVVWLIAVSLKLFGVIRFKAVNFTIKSLVALIAISIIVGLFTIGTDASFYFGGLHGYYINMKIIQFVGWIGAVIFAIFLICLFGIICLNDLRVWVLKIKQKRDMLLEQKRLYEEELAQQKLKKETMEKIEDDMLHKYEEYNEEFVCPQMTFQDSDLSKDSPIEEESVLLKDEEIATQQISIETIDNDKSSDTRVEESMIVNVNQIGESIVKNIQPSVYDPTAELSKYKFPHYEILNDTKMRISVDQEEQKENQEKIRKTLLDFDIPIVSIEATVGPTVTLYEIIPDKGVRIAKIRNLVDDIALSLSAVGVRIIAPIPGKGTVGIEVANKDPQTVSMRTIITSRKYQESKYELPIALGATISNGVYIADLAKMPHLLVAGATGQGKSVGLNTIITSLLYRKHPAELKFVLIDPKMVEFSLYAKLEKHYLAKLPDEDEPIITDPGKVVATLSSLCVEMDNRYNLLKNASTRNIKEYNDKFKSKVLNPEKGHRFLPYIVVIVDEFSDLIMTAGKEVEMPIARIAQKARAVGIHMIIATQRPSTNVITGIIKANFPARMAFKVSSGVDSKTILDTTGAQQLIGRGDMLLSSNSEMERVQCAFIDTPEVEAICEHISSQVGYSQPYLLPEPILESDAFGIGSGSDVNNTFGDRDPLFEEIARKIVNSNTASTSSLQRHYSIGYNRAGKIMDQMEAAGIVGPAQGGKPRVVLVDPITLETILNS